MLADIKLCSTVLWMHCHLHSTGPWAPVRKPQPSWSPQPAQLRMPTYHLNVQVSSFSLAIFSWALYRLLSDGTVQMMLIQLSPVYGLGQAWACMEEVWFPHDPAIIILNVGEDPAQTVNVSRTHKFCKMSLNQLHHILDGWPRQHVWHPARGKIVLPPCVKVIWHTSNIIFIWLIAVHREVQCLDLHQNLSDIQLPVYQCMCNHDCNHIMKECWNDSGAFAKEWYIDERRDKGLYDKRQLWDQGNIRVTGWPDTHLHFPFHECVECFCISRQGSGKALVQIQVHDQQTWIGIE